VRLPNVEHGQIAKEKVVNYLLSFEHRDGRSKANFFTRFGFSSDDWQTMANALLEHAKGYEVQTVEPSTFGNRFVIEGPIQCPDGRRPLIRAV
jgi:hypothetical protein